MSVFFTGYYANKGIPAPVDKCEYMDLSQFKPNTVYFPVQHLKSYLASIVKKVTSFNSYYKVQKTDLLDKILCKYKLTGGRKEEVYFVANQSLWILDNTDRTNFLCYSYRKKLLPFYNKNLKGVIKTQFYGKYDYSFRVHPFVYQSDYRLDNPNVLSRIRSLTTDKYTSSIFARWDSRKDERVVRRRKWIESCKSIPNIDIRDSRKKLNWQLYMQKIATAQFALSANGRGPICSRDMEIASTGTPMLRERLKATMYFPFESGVHYIEVNLSNIVEKFQYYSENYDESVNIGKNAKKYFDSYLCVGGMQKIFSEIISSSLASD